MWAFLAVLHWWDGVGVYVPPVLPITGTDRVTWMLAPTFAFRVSLTAETARGGS